MHPTVDAWLTRRLLPDRRSPRGTAALPSEPGIRRALRLLTLLTLGIVAGVGGAHSSRADVRLPRVFGDHMVLQRDQPIRVWGWSAPGETVTVEIADNPATTTADARGRWQVTLPALPAGGPVPVTITGRNQIVLKDVLVGEVWLASGQSNMQWPLSATDGAEKDRAEATFPSIRLFSVPRVTAGMPVEDVDAQWTACSPETVWEFSAVAYHFGREIHQALGVPVGLINSSWGGTRIEPWTPLEGFAGVPALEAIRRQLELALPTEPRHQATLGAYLKTLEDWLASARDALARHTLVPAMPPYPAELLPLNNSGVPAAIYNAMIHPLIPFGIRGALWYQGESNRPEGMLYFEKMKALIQGWRTLWGQGDFPFYYVQLAPFTYGGNGQTLLPKLWEAQTAALALPETGMAVINDIGHLTDIHPRNKRDVGHRLSLWALAKTYGRDVPVYSGPLVRSYAIEGNRIRVRFDHVGGGLASRDGQPLNWFEIAGADQNYVKAEAVIDQDTVLVSSPSVPRPISVRFAWHEQAVPNLMNREGLPASAFRVGEPPVRNDIEERIPAARGYLPVLRLNLPVEANYADQPVPYDLDTRAELSGPFDRLAYYLELQEPGAEPRYVFVSMKAFTQDPAKFGIPTVGSRAVFQQPVDDMTVFSNVPGLPQGEHRGGGNIEFWPSNYGQENRANVPNASGSAYDFGDSGGSVERGYGSMQIHDHDARVTLFAYNRWGGGGGPSDLGIGNAPSGHPDWTFAGNAGRYTVRRLLVLARPGIPAP